MNISELSIKRPVFITAIATVLLFLGIMSIRKMPVDLFPNITFPVIMVQTIYPGAGPKEIETLVSKVLEDEMSNVPGIKALRSTNVEGASTVIAEFNLEMDIKYAEQQIRDKVSAAKRKLPDGIEEPVIRRIDPADQPIMILSVSADLGAAELFDLAENQIKPRLEQINQVGLVQVIGARKREIQVQLDQDKLKKYQIPATNVAARIGAAGQNIPAGKVDAGRSETTFRTLGEFKSISDIGDVIVSFFGNEVPVTVREVGQVTDTVTDEKSRAFVNGKKSVFLMLFRQSGSNTIAVANSVKAKMEDINKTLKTMNGKGELVLVRDTSKMIRDNVYDVLEAILIGIVLTIVVVYLFLGSGRSTFITGLALPTSLIGSFFLMSMAGFTINIMSLLALSLAVGLLIDDAIVVRENIYRHVELGLSPMKAALFGAKEVQLAVVAVTLAVISVFAPIGFLQGIVGQFFKEFGLTICFAMAISLFDALTMAPMLSAYYAGHSHGIKDSKGFWGKIAGVIVIGFDKFQTYLENTYAKILTRTNRHPFLVIGASLVVFAISIYSIKFIPKTFLPTQDTGEFSITIDLEPGASLNTTAETAKQIDDVIRSNKEIERSVMFVGSFTGEPNKGTFFVQMVPSKQRQINTSAFKDRLREQLKPFAYARPIVKDIDLSGGGQRPFNINIVGNNLNQIEEYSFKLFEKIKAHPGLKDADINYRPGKPEFQVVPDNRRAEQLGVATSAIGLELRTLIEGATPAVFRENGEEYDIRVRLKDDQRNLKERFSNAFVPNMNQRIIRLKDVASPVETTGPASISRENRARYVQISADIAPNGPGMGGVMADIDNMLKNELKLPEGVSYSYVGQAENFKELIGNMILAAITGILFVYLVLASLYESFITPFTIMLVLPLAACGAFFALLATGASLDIFSMIGCILLLGVATKNSIILVDYTNQLIAKGMTHAEAVVEAGRVRLRPILMTTIALIAGMLPIAIGLNEASKQRTGMGIAVIGGLISSTLLTLLVVPAAYTYLERFRSWSLRVVRRAVGVSADDMDMGDLESEDTKPLKHDEHNIKVVSSHESRIKGV
jgi:HAE1 family hydrophobic/amphiphilic exporter-1